MTMKIELGLYIHSFPMLNGNMCELFRASRNSCYVRASKKRRRVCSLVGCYFLALSFIHFDIFFSLLPQCILLIDPFSVCPSPSNNDSDKIVPIT